MLAAQSCGHQRTGYMTVQAILVLASGERSIHDHTPAFFRTLLDRRAKISVCRGVGGVVAACGTIVMSNEPR